jgi:hypothetical protein
MTIEREGKQKAEELIVNVPNNLPPFLPLFIYNFGKLIFLLPKLIPTVFNPQL